MEKRIPPSTWTRLKHAFSMTDSKRFFLIPIGIKRIELNRINYLKLLTNCPVKTVSSSKKHFKMACRSHKIRWPRCLSLIARLTSQASPSKSTTQTHAKIITSLNNSKMILIKSAITCRKSKTAYTKKVISKKLLLHVFLRLTRRLYAQQFILAMGSHSSSLN